MGLSPFDVRQLLLAGPWPFRRDKQAGVETGSPSGWAASPGSVADDLPLAFQQLDEAPETISAELLTKAFLGQRRI